MYLLKNARNQGGPKQHAQPGDVVVSRDFKSTYVVGNNGEFNAVRDLGDHQHAVNLVKVEQVLLQGDDISTRVFNAHMDREAEQFREERARRFADAEARRLANLAEDARLRLWRNRFGRVVLGLVPRKWHQKRAIWPFSSQDWRPKKLSA